jgi:hypothetical protein
MVLRCNNGAVMILILKVARDKAVKIIIIIMKSMITHIIIMIIRKRKFISLYVIAQMW